MARYPLLAVLIVAGSASAASNPPTDERTATSRPDSGAMRQPAPAGAGTIQVQPFLPDSVETKQIEFTGRGAGPKLPESVTSKPIHFTGRGLPPQLPESVTSKPIHFTGRGQGVTMHRPQNFETNPRIQRQPQPQPQMQPLTPLPQPPDDTDIR
jgi:hypothetical protein